MKTSTINPVSFRFSLPEKARVWLLTFLLVTSFTGIALLFWYNDWVYNLPTPVPENHVEVPAGTYIDITQQFQTDASKPVFLHFYNPDCPCSRFNLPHFRTLARQYGDKVNFGIVVMSKDTYTVKQIQDKFSLNIPVTFDTTLAKTCGVYSTPQAAILDVNRKLYYKGNYNKSRYCTDPKSDYAQMALDSLLNHSANALNDNPFAVKSYGCTLPNCGK